jgi:uncharacterized protein YggE
MAVEAPIGTMTGAMQNQGATPKQYLNIDRAAEYCGVSTKTYAELIGVELGDIVYLTEINAPTNVVAAKSSDAMAEGAATQIDLGTQEVTVTVEVRWKLG